MSETKVKAPAPKGISGVNLKGKHAVLRQPSHAEYSIIQRVVLCMGGFGCNPASMGRAVFAVELVNGIESRFDRSDIERLATDEEVAEAQRFYNTSSFEAVSKKYERGLKLLLSISQNGRKYRLLKHKKKRGYNLLVYETRNDKCDVVEATADPDSADKLLVLLSKKVR